MLSFLAKRFCPYNLRPTFGEMVSEDNGDFEVNKKVGQFLFQLFSEIIILHTPKFCHLVHWFQDCFCFCCATFPFHVGTFFGVNGNFNGKMININKMAKNHFSGVQNGSQSVEMGVLGGYLY